MTGIWRLATYPRLHRNHAEPPSAVRNVIVPSDIIPVVRRSPVRVKKRTPWRRQPDGHPTERAGNREWFSDRVFVETELGHANASRAISAVVHSIGVLMLGALLLTRSTELPRVAVRASLTMPVMMSLVPIGGADSTAPRLVSHAKPKETPSPVTVPAPEAGARPPVPVETPSTIEPETGGEIGEGGGGGDGGSGQGRGDGRPDGTFAQGLPSPGPLRVGGGILPPRKIKDVRPVYPDAALSGRSRATVIIEAIVGTDGLVHEAVVLQHSTPSFDQAALDAVRQWQYAPSFLNGVATAIVMTIVVNFAIQ